MPVLIKSKIDVKNFPSIRAWRAAMTLAHDAQGQYWHKHMLKEHFKRESRSKYGYKQRSEKYLKRKKYGKVKGIKAKYKGEVDLVATGALEDAVRGFATFRAFPSRVTVAMNGPSYIRINYRANRPHLSNEITAVVPDEIKTLEAVLDGVVTPMMNRSGETRTINP